MGAPIWRFAVLRKRHFPSTFLNEISPLACTRRRFSISQQLQWCFNGFQAARRPRSRLRRPPGAPQELLWPHGPSQRLFKGSPEASNGSPEGSQGRPSGVPRFSPRAHLGPGPPGPLQGVPEASNGLPRGIQNGNVLKVKRTQESGWRAGGRGGAFKEFPTGW